MFKDQRDLLLAFNAHNVRYILVGGYALGRYTEPRATKDLDIFVDIAEENSQNVFKALADFGAPLAGYTPEDFQNPYQGFQIGVAPSQIDIIFAISGLSFEPMLLQYKHPAKLRTRHNHHSDSTYLNGRIALLRQK